MKMRRGLPMDFFKKPDAGFRFARMNDVVQGLILILTVNSQLVPLLKENICEVMKGLTI